MATGANTLAATGMVVLAAGVCALPRTVAADDPAAVRPILCLVFVGPEPGLGQAHLREGIVLEQRKQDAIFNVAVVLKPEQCPGRGTAGGAVAIVSGASVSFDGPEGTVESFDAAAVPSFDRPQVVARWIVAVFAAQLRGEMVPVVDFPFAWLPVTPQPEKVLWWTVEAGGAYEHQPGPSLNTGSVEVAGGVGLYDEMLWAGLEIGYQPPTAPPSSTLGAKVQAVAFSAQVRGGVLMDPVLLRAGFGVGLEWRRIRFGQAVAAAQRIRSSVLPVLEGEAGLTARLPENVRLTIAATVRGFLKGDGFTMQGSVDYDPPRYSVGAVLRVGIVFPRPYAGP